MEVNVNYLAVFLAAVSTMVVGSIWYAPGVFGNMWMKLAKVKVKTDGGTAGMAFTYIMAFVLSLITAYVLAHVSMLSNHFFNHSFLQDTLTTAFWLWLGFTAARLAMHDLFEDRRKKLTLLNVAHEFVTIMVMALIIGMMGV
ncbi:MAG TPA: DUF1761 domain-containing protein [Candidatus Saccharimonadales bacterium]